MAVSQEMFKGDLTANSNRQQQHDFSKMSQVGVKCFSILWMTFTRFGDLVNMTDLLNGIWESPMIAFTLEHILGNNERQLWYVTLLSLITEVNARELVTYFLILRGIQTRSRRRLWSNINWFDSNQS